MKIIGIVKGEGKLPIQSKASPKHFVEFNRYYNQLTELEGRMEHSPFFENGKHSEIQHTLINQLVGARETVMSIMKELK